ncbi:signal peptidase I [Streptomyces sp. NBC_01808]|uniref:signal peptidase I n=1 Tax=Streptomyces sp. NBC_01808 TaxID=2975947 RepID=UPI003FA3574E
MPGGGGGYGGGDPYGRGGAGDPYGPVGSGPYGAGGGHREGPYGRDGGQDDGTYGSGGDDPYEPEGDRGPGGAPGHGGEPGPRLGGRAERRKAAKRARRRRTRSRIKEIPLIIGAAMLIALGVKTFLLQAFVIPSGSMEQTIRIGDRVVVDKLTPWFGAKPERGDIVVFKDPGGWLSNREEDRLDDPVGVAQAKDVLTFIGLLPSEHEQDLIKRVVAVGGDRVVCCDDGGRVTVNGTALVESYLHPGDKPSQRTFDVTVPDGRIFVMGDHRSNSADSRYHLDGPYQGTIAEEDVVGRAMAIAWPLGHWDKFDSPDTYASVPESDAQANKVSSKEVGRMEPLPTPAELSLVMGVVGLHLTRGRQRQGEEWMWGTWQSAPGPVTRIQKTGPVRGARSSRLPALLAALRSRRQTARRTPPRTAPPDPHSARAASRRTPRPALPAALRRRKRER